MEKHVEKAESALKERVEELGEQVKERFAPVDKWLRNMAEEQPLVMLAGAIGIGYLIGRFMRRS